MTPEELEAIAAKWLQVCGACDAGMGPCTHPTDEDYRTPMLRLLNEIELLRDLIDRGIRPPKGEKLRNVLGIRGAVFVVNWVQA